jgi:putative alpha-1,2-mannosidase
MTNWNIKFKKMDIFETNEREKRVFYRFIYPV